MDLDYNKDIAIDRFNLDSEWKNHSTLTMQYAEAAANADREAKRAEEKVKTIRSELILKASKEGVPGLNKAPTAAQAEAYYRTHSDYLTAKEEQIELEHEADILKSVGFAFNHRKAALENLVRLQLQSYYSAPQ